MDDILMVCCGGGIHHIMEPYMDRFSSELIFINKDDGSPGSSRDWGSCPCPDNVSFLNLDDAEGIGTRMRGKRVVFVLSILGGDTGLNMMHHVIGVARDHGCSVVSLVGVPMKFEEGRRGRAMDALPELVVQSDRLFILDVDTIFNMNIHRRSHFLFNAIDSSISFAAHGLYDAMEGPFFSTFTQKVYTFAYSSELDPADAVNKALDSTMFESDPAGGKLIVLVGSGFGRAEVDSVYGTVVGMSGIMPDIVKRSDCEDTKVLVFLPVSPDDLSSPRASRT